MNCLQFEEGLRLAIDTEVVGELRAAFATHLAECPVCQTRLLQEHLVEEGIVRAAKKIAAPRALHRRLKSLAQKERQNEAHTHVLIPLALVALLLLTFCFSRSDLQHSSRPELRGPQASEDAAFGACVDLHSSLRQPYDQYLSSLDQNTPLSRIALAANPRTDLEITRSHQRGESRSLGLDYAHASGGRHVLRWYCQNKQFVLRSPCPSRCMMQVAHFFCGQR